jgi:hypothetical protein
MQLISVIECSCRYCGSERRSIIASALIDVEEGVMGHYDIARCQDCRFVYLSRTPDPLSLGACYSNSYYTRTDAKQGFVSTQLYRVKNELRYRGLMRLLHAPPSSLLEV